MSKVLIVEDEIAILDLIKMELELRGYRCDLTNDGKLGADYIEKNSYDLLLLDVMLPNVDGYELLEYNKQTRQIPTIFITAKSQVKDKIKGLNEGADDYITKPFDMDELVARVEAVLRRYNKVNEIKKIDDIEINALMRKPVFVAMRDKFIKAYPQLEDARVFDYCAKEEFAILNALPTAEGAVECAMSRYEGVISGSKCLVVGFGKIGKILAKTLRALDAHVTVSARKDNDFAYIKALGYNAQNTLALKNVKGFDIVFNTVPKLIFDKQLLMNTDSNTMIIDLASLPGGVDFEAAHKFNIDAVRALSLPGKCAPKTAGEIIKTTVFNIIEEVYR